MGEAINLVENFKVEKVIFNCEPYNDLEKELIKVLDKKKIKYYSCIKKLNINNNKLYFLQTKEYNNENDNTSVIYTNINNNKILLMGDAGVEVEKDLIEKYNLNDIDILKVGHHGSKTSSSKTFIEHIYPKYSIISVGKNNLYKHPNKEVLINLNNSKIYRTDKYGSIIFDLNNNKLKIGKVSHKDIGQMQMYVNYYNRNVKNNNENKTIGILLSTDKNETIVKYTLPEDNNTIFSSEFTLIIPTEQKFIDVIEEEKKNLMLL